MNHKIKLIAVDMDGTLLNSRGEMPEDFESWVRTHPSIKTVIASGRQYYNLLKQFPNMEQEMLFVADNGAIIFYHGKMIYANEMKREDILYCIEQFHEKEGFPVILSGVKSAYMEHSTEDAESNAHKYYERLEFTNDLRTCIEKDQIVKVAIFFPGHKAEERYHKPMELSEEVVEVLSGDSWIDVANRTVNKGQAIQIIQKDYEIFYEESMAFGDYLNDLKLLESCGESYAMGNAHQDLKEMAKHITGTNDEEGVMQVLRKLL